VISSTNLRLTITDAALLLPGGKKIAQNDKEDLPILGREQQRRVCILTCGLNVTVGIMSHQVTCTACNVEHVA
jgi:hypothetical protein